MVIVHQELRQESRSLHTVWTLKLEDYSQLHWALEAGGITLVNLPWSGAWLSAQWAHKPDCDGALQRDCLSEVASYCPSSL